MTSHNKNMEQFTFNSFLNLSTRISVPNYQRAYSWGRKQILDFISDLTKIRVNTKYYFGHFIAELYSSNSSLEIIDGQQRVTTFIIFLIACKKFKQLDKYEEIVSKFKTVTYDNHILEALKENNSIEEILSNAKTKSSVNIIEAFKMFIDEFNSGNNLNIENIENYIQYILNADASHHLTESKNVAVKMFEMHNSRGLPLTTIEKVKTKLMGTVYNYSENNEANSNVMVIQDTFAKVFELEEKLLNNTFRGQIKLDELLLTHLRVIDDGRIKAKGATNLENLFHSPARSGNREVMILEYVENAILNLAENKTKIVYCLNLAKEFLRSVVIMSCEVIEADQRNHIIGDCLIFEREITTEFYLLLFRSEAFQTNDLIFRKWEKLLFIRNFHEKYYRKMYTDNFQRLYYQFIENKIHDITPEVFKVEDLLDHALNKGFRPDLMDENSLTKTVKNYLCNISSKEKILLNGFNWWKPKMSYLLYKYELSIDNKILLHLRNVIKDSISIEHILPQSWEWHWINADENNLTGKNKDFEKAIYNSINGIGNLVILTTSENSSQSNSHPKEKVYNLNEYGSYKKHEENKARWESYENWINLIEERGSDIYDFMKNYFELELA